MAARIRKHCLKQCCAACKTVIGETLEMQSMILTEVKAFARYVLGGIQSINRGIFEPTLSIGTHGDLFEHRIPQTPSRIHVH